MIARGQNFFQQYVYYRKLVQTKKAPISEPLWWVGFDPSCCLISVFSVNTKY